jgi:hypothetical protein
MYTDGGHEQMKHTMKKCITSSLILSFLLTALPLLHPAEEIICKLDGFVYSDDGKKPLPDAVVMLRETVSQKVYQSEKAGKNGVYKIEKLLPGTYSVGILYKDKEYNVDVLLQIKYKKQMACFTLPRVTENPGYAVRCQSPKCFFIRPCGWALVAGITSGITYGIIKITEQQVSQTTI